MGHVQDRWTELGPPDENGKRRRVRNGRWGKGLRWRARWIEHGEEASKSFTSKDAAELHLAQMITAPRTRRTELTVRDFSALWLANQLHYADQTRRVVGQRFTNMILPTLGKMSLSDVTRSDVQRLVLGWTQSYAPATVRQAYSFLSTMFAAAVRDDYVKASPCAAVNLPKRERKRIVPLTAEQIEQIAERIAPRYRSMVIVGAATGLRPGELFGMTWDHVTGNELLVARQLVEDKHGHLGFAPPKSNAGYRRVGFGPVVREALDHQAAEFPSLGFIWTTRQKGPIDREVAGRAWHQATEGLVLRDRSGWHDLRHYHASVLIAGGASPAAVAERLGHSDPAETLRTYAHLWPSDHERMVAISDAALSGFAGPSGAVVPFRKRSG